MKTIDLGTNLLNINRSLQNCNCIDGINDNLVLRFTRLINNKTSDQFVLASAYTLALMNTNVNTTHIEFVTSLTPTPTVSINLQYGHYHMQVYLINSYTFNFTTPVWSDACLFYEESAFCRYKQ